MGRSFSSYTWEGHLAVHLEAAIQLRIEGELRTVGAPVVGVQTHGTSSLGSVVPGKGQAASTRQAGGMGQVRSTLQAAKVLRGGTHVYCVDSSAHKSIEDCRKYN